MFYKLLISIFFFLPIIIPFSVNAQENDALRSDLLIRENKIDSALIILSNEIQKTTNEKEKAFAFLKMGNAYKLKQEYEKALDNYRKALHIFKKEKAIQEEFYTYTYCAELYRYIRQYKKAKNYLAFCEQILRKNKIIDDYLIKYYDRKSALFSKYKAGNDSSLVYSKKALALSQKIGNKESMMTSMMEISTIYEGEKKFLQAIKLLKDAISLSKQTDDRHAQAGAMINLSRNYDKIKAYDKSVQEALNGFSFSEQNNLDYEKLMFADHLQYMYAKTNDYKNAHKYLTIRLNLTEEYYQKLYNDKFLEYEEKFQTAEKQKIINEKEKTLKLKEEEIKRQNRIKYAILSGLVVIIFFSGILIYYIRIIKKQNKELAFISEQNEFLVAETHHRINNNLQLITILIENELDKVLDTDEVSKKNILAKIDSLGLLHRQLYRNKDKKDLDLKEFLQDIRKNMDFLMTDHRVESDFKIEEVIIPINQAMYIGLLVTELCINSLKHAFADQKDKKITLLITKQEDKISFDYRDNGKKTGTLPKLVLIDQLCRQLKVDYKAELDNGFRLRFML